MRKHVTRLFAIVALAVAGNLAHAQTPLQKYERLIEELGSAGYTSGQVKSIALVAQAMTVVKVCPPEEGRNSAWVSFTVNDTARDFGRPKDELVAKANELVPAMSEALADPAMKLDVCGPQVDDQEAKPKQ